METHNTVETLAEAIQGIIVSCPNEQTYDEGMVWIFGHHTDIEELLYSYDVPEKLKDDVVDLLVCPGCQNPIERGQDVGVKFDFEIEHEEMLERAERLFSERLFDFSRFISRFPYLGGQHHLGQEIIKTIEKFPRSSLKDQTWYRARRVESGRPFKVNDLRPPDPEKVEVPEGRFNHFGQAFWYLSSTSDATAAEVCDRGERIVWVQEWNIQELQDVLDLRAWLPDEDRAFDDEGHRKDIPLLAVALIFGDHATKKPEGGIGWKPEYFVPRFVADVARNAGFSGILFRSPRHYEQNLVVFDREAPFEPVDEPRLIELPSEFDEERDAIFLFQGYPDSYRWMNSIPFLSGDITGKEEGEN